MTSLDHPGGPQLEVIDRQRALDLLDKALTERGEDYVYESPNEDGICVYVDQGQPSCLVGHALVIHGVAIEHLESHDLTPAQSLPIPCISNEAGQVFRAAQLRQDLGDTWGESVRCAHETAS